MGETRIHISLAIFDLAAKHYEITQRIDACEGDTLRLRMPSWVPGSYLIRDYARHVIGFRATSEGRELHHDKEDKSTWVVDLAGAKSCEVHYRVYADELTVRTNDITHDHAFVNPGGCFLAVVDREDEPYAVSIDPPKGWKVHASLKPDSKGRHVARDFDQLVDSPFELGPFEAETFKVGGTKHRLAIAGSGNYDLKRILADTKKICEAEVELFGELPTDDYLFILLLTESRGGGLEHCDSSVLAWPKLGFRPEKEYRKFLTLVAHEYFHLWNVKRIRPSRFLDFDYSTEVHTKLLWIFEGITSYYDQLIPMRAGVYGASEYFELIAERIVAEQSRGGRTVQSLEESSYDTWTRFYRPTPDSYNSQVSYYERGELVALLLDLHLRRETKDKKSLDDVMRLLYHEIAKAGKGLDEGGFGEVVQRATGVDVSDFLGRYVEGTEPLDYGETFAGVGIDSTDSRKDEEKRQAWLGAVIESSAGSSKLGHVAIGGSAHGAGLMTGDEIVALDGHRVRAGLEDRLKLYTPGETAEWTAFRRDRLVSGRIEFLENPHPPIKIVARTDITEAQRGAFHAWSGVEFQKAFKAKDS